ncbi:MAG TPA: circularly permuted type 2 ATP-grasp protein [Pseudobdellovibrionaceae bacterium]|mgnify:CR=1 FL=1|nr:circularly permuted type 2 ATP-grasp protein [Pseudobdellovibrionaceae bacterium]
MRVLIRKVRKTLSLSMLPGLGIMWACLGAEAVRADEALVAPAPQGHYDELYHPNGEIRPHYRGIVEVAREISPTRVQRIERETRRDFHKDNMLSPVPRILVSTEFDHYLRPGVEQRGRALREFLLDFHRSGGEPRLVREGRMPREVLDRVVARNLESGLVGSVREITFFYGPDVVRDPRGVFRVVEDNTGFLGGFGDLRIALESLERHVPEYNERLGRRVAERDPMEFYRQLAQRYTARAQGGRVVMLQIPPYADFEDRRVMRLMREAGIEVVTPHTRARLQIDAQGAWLLPADGGRRERVGFLAINGEHWWMDMHDARMWPVAMTEYAKLTEDEVRSKLRRLGEDRLTRWEREFLAVMSERDPRTGLPQLDRLEAALRGMNDWQTLSEWKAKSYPGLLDAILSGRVASNYSPGTNFVNDKEFYLYMEEVVRTYLAEEPILRNIRTEDAGERVGDRILPRTEFLNSVSRDKDRWVIKVVDGRGGSGIYVGAKISQAEFDRGLDEARREPWRYKIQEYTPLSVMGSQIVDLRIHSDVPPRGRVMVSDVPWGRSLPLHGDGKVNLSAQGRETTVMVRAAEPFCRMIFSRAQ